MTFSINLVWSISLVFYLEGGRRTGEVSFTNNTARLFQFRVLLSWWFISHPLLLTAVGLRQPISHCHHPTRWIKNKANSRLLLPFPPLLISLTFILKPPLSVLNESLHQDEPSLEAKICLLQDWGHLMDITPKSSLCRAQQLYNLKSSMFLLRSSFFLGLVLFLIYETG